MEHISKKFLLLATCVLVCLGLVKFDTKVKADAVVKNTSGQTLVKSVSVKTNKVIKVTEKSQSSGQSTSLSRGGNERTDIVSYAYKFMGKPYVWGAEGPSAFDCSGFTLYVYSKFGVSLPHYTGSQFQMGQSVQRGNLKSGDLVFFNTSGPISHVGIYIGGGQFIHASSGSHKITVSDLGESYYSSRYAGARRILN